MKKSCSTCEYFEETTKFCRKDPPVPNEVQEFDKTQTHSKWPVIPFPLRDYCWWWKPISAHGPENLELIQENKE